MPQSAEVVVRRAFDMVNRRSFEDAPEFIAPEFARHDLASIWGDHHGPGEVKDFLGALVAACPDLHIEIDQLLVADDYVTVRFHGTGTHTGEPMMGVATTGAVVDWNGINIYHVVDGMIAESWQLSDGLALYRALGLLRSL